MNQKERHLHDYIQVIMRRRWIIFTFFTVLVVTVLLGTIKQVPLYRATAILRIKHSSPHVVSVRQVTPMGSTGDIRTSKDYYETQYKLITSRTLLKKVADSLGLEPHVAPAQGGPVKKLLKAALEGADDSLDLKPQDPHEVSNPVKKFLKAALAEMSDFFNLRRRTPHEENDPVERLQKCVKVTPVRNSQLVEVSAQDPDPWMAALIANTVSGEYVAYNLEMNIEATGNAAEWLSKKTEDQRQKLMDAELALQKYRIEHNINILPQTTGGDAIENIKAEYAKLQSLRANYTKRYTDEHPKMIELTAQIKSLRSKIQGLEGVDAGNKTMEFRVLEREVETNKHMYQILLARLKEVDVSSDLNVSNINIIDRAEVPKKPAKPNIKLNMVLAVLAGLVMGIGLGFFVDYLDRTIKSPEDIKNILKAHCLGAIPEIVKTSDKKKARIVHLRPKSHISEAYRDIRTEISHLMPNNGSRAILITSAEPRAGKTITSTNLGIAFSKQGYKVLLVDSDLRKPQMNKLFSLDRGTGLSEFLWKEMNLGSVIRDTKIENLKVVTAGGISWNPSEAVGSSRMKQFVDDAKQEFDFIFIDSPPVASVTDAVILADVADGIIHVVGSGMALVPVVEKVKEKLESTGKHVLGIVLNNLKSTPGTYYYYGSYRYYGRYGK